MLLHQAVDTLGIDRRVARGSPLALDERGDPPVAVGRPGVHEAADFGSERKVAVACLWSALRTRAFEAFGDVGPGDAEGVGDRLHREASRGTELDSEIAFFVRASSRASLRTSTSSVLRPSRRSSSRTRSSRRRTSEAGTTSSSARTAPWPPSVISRLHRNTRLGESPYRRAT